MKNINGYTLIELIICLSIIGLVATGIAGLAISTAANNNRILFNTECETIRDEIVEARNAALMTEDNYGVTLRIYSNSLAVLKYKEEDRSMSTKTIRLKYGRMTNNFGSTNPSFNGAGVINKGGTITFYRNNKAEQFIVIQPVTGRIYLTDEKPN